MAYHTKRTGRSSSPERVTYIHVDLQERACTYIYGSTYASAARLNCTYVCVLLGPRWYSEPHCIYELRWGKQPAVPVRVFHKAWYQQLSPSGCSFVG
jgi:hypothetical protein